MQSFKALGAMSPALVPSAAGEFALPTCSSWGALPPDTHWPLTAGGSTPRPPKRPSPPPPLAILWLRACTESIGRKKSNNFLRGNFFGQHSGLCVKKTKVIDTFCKTTRYYEKNKLTNVPNCRGGQSAIRSAKRNFCNLRNCGSCVAL